MKERYADIDRLLIRTGTMVAVPCAQCASLTMWPPSRDPKECICNECEDRDNGAVNG